MAKKEKEEPEIRKFRTFEDRYFYAWATDPNEHWDPLQEALEEIEEEEVEELIEEAIKEDPPKEVIIKESKPKSPELLAALAELDRMRKDLEKGG